MKPHYYIKNPEHPITVNVIGAGGTGSLVIPRLARMDFALKKLGHPGLMVFAYDGDKVEEHNIGRQNFSDSDLGRNKAVVMIEKCNLAMGLLWKAYPRMYKPTNQNSANIMIICVDNAKFRTDYYHWLSTKREKPVLTINIPFYIIDNGNGKNFGQTILYSTDNQSKSFVELFPDAEEQDTEELQGIRGCGYAESLSKQDLFINDEMALNTCKLMWKLFRDKEVPFNGIISNQEKLKSLPIKLSL